MAKGSIKKTDYPEVPEDTYKAKLTKIEQRETAKGDVLMWRFELLEEPHKGRWATGLTPTTATTRNRFGQFLSVLDPDLQEGDEWDTDDYVGTKVRVETFNRKGGDGQVFVNVEKLKPWKRVADSDADTDVERPKKKKRATDDEEVSVKKKSKRVVDEDDDDEDDDL